MNRALLLAIVPILCVACAGEDKEVPPEDRLQRVQVEPLAIGSRMPSFSLQDAVSGRVVSDAALRGAPLSLVVVTKNTCPYATRWEERVVEWAREAIGEHGAQVVAANASVRLSPMETPARMKLRATENSWPYPYLLDDDQALARALGAQVTPHLFLFTPDRGLVWHGRPDDNWMKPDEVEKRYLHEAAEAALAGEDYPMTEEMSAIGCALDILPALG